MRQARSFVTRSALGAVALAVLPIVLFSNIPVILAADGLPRGVDAEWWAEARRAIEAAEYRISWQDDSAINGMPPSWHAPNRAHRFRTYFTDGGPRVVPRAMPGKAGTVAASAAAGGRGRRAGEDWTIGFEWVAWGRGGVSIPVPAATLAPDDNRIEYRRHRLIEWYANEPGGLEQGFTLPEPPSVALREGAPGAHLVHIDLALRGPASPRFADDGQSVQFDAGGGFGIATYDRLQVADAGGRRLPARMEGFVAPHGTGIRIVIDTTRAVYPIAVDPWLSTAGATREIDQDIAFFGWSVASAGDVNADGYSDIIVGAERYDNGQINEGRAFVYHGSSSGLSFVADWFAEIDLAGAAFGYAVSTAGDVNGDGFADVIIGARAYANGQASEGQALVYHGSPAGLATTPAWMVESNSATALFGNSVGAAGDVNGDGYSDVLVGAPQYDNGENNEGGAWLYLGSASGLDTTADWSIEGNLADALLGHSLAGAGDVNGDGYSDVVVGIPQYTDTLTWQGRVEGYYGSAAGFSSTADWFIDGDQAGGNLGWSVSTAGDVNGDGYADIIAGAQQYDNVEFNEGRAYVFLGSAGGLDSVADWTAEINQASAKFGDAVSTAGDVNGDGYADVIVGADQYDNGETDEGGAWLYLGSPAGIEATPIWTFESDQADAEAGTAVAAAGDVNGDGLGDVLIGAHRYDNLQTDEGRVWLFTGLPGLLSGGPAATPADGGGAPYAVASAIGSAGDVNGDGYDDLLLGERLYDDDPWGRGRAMVFYGSPTGFSRFPDWTIVHDPSTSDLGASAAGIGDIDGDGYADIVVSSGHAFGFPSGGEAWVFHGSPTGLPGGPLATESDADWRMVTDFGYPGLTGSLAGGDVNGDGYSDLAIGNVIASNCSNTHRVLVFYGSPNGLKGAPLTTASNADWILNDGQGDCITGNDVDISGDVNGDGYADLLIGDRRGSPDPLDSRALLYYGSAAGLSGGPTATVADADWQELAFGDFGASAAYAGDVNRDGFSDIIISNTLDTVAPDAGRVDVYYGSSSGLSAIPYWTLEETEDFGDLGTQVGTAGDVNGDGYSDIFVTAPGHDGLPTLYIYQGSASGLSGGFSPTFADADWSFEEVPMDLLLAATLGDLNGDGSSEFGFFGERSIGTWVGYAFFGNGYGVPIGLEQLRAGDGAPIVPGTLSDTGDSFGLTLVGRSPFGRGRVKLEREVKPAGVPFDGGGTVVSPGWDDSGTAGVTLLDTVTGLTPGSSHTWRARVLHDPVTTPLLPASRWVTDPAAPAAAIDVRLSPASTDLSVTIADAVDPVMITRDIAYTIDVSNAGPAAAIVTLRHELPDGAGATVAVPTIGSCNVTTETIVCALGNMAPGANASLMVTTAASPMAGSYVSDAVVYATGADLQPADNSASATTDVLDPMIGDRVWEDVDGDGVQDAGEPGMAGVFVLLLDDTGSLLQFFETDASGAYSFPNVTVDTTYSVRFIPPATHVLSPADQGSDDALDSDVDPLTEQTPPILLVDGQDPVRWDAGVMPFCVPPDEAIFIEGAGLGPADETILSFQDFNQPVQVTGYNVHRSSDPAAPPATWPLIATDIIDGDAATPNHQWADTTGDVSPSGVWYYQVVAYNHRCAAAGPF